MRIGILGSGLMGAKLGTIFTLAEAARDSDALLLAAFERSQHRARRRHTC
jgi:hypothetical protein